MNLASLLLGLLMAAPPPGTPGPPGHVPGAEAVRVHRPIRADTSAPLRGLIAADRLRRPLHDDAVVKPREVANRRGAPATASAAPTEPAFDPLVQRSPSEQRAPALMLSVPGFSNADNVALNGGQIAPADPNGDVGLVYYIQYMNAGWSVFDKTDGSLVAGPFRGNSFWLGFGGRCESDNAGDPIVLYDEFADRWLFAQFAAPIESEGRQCVAVSATSDPFGAYHRYEFAVPFLDYPKMGVFTDGGGHSGYYFGSNNFGGTNGSFSGVSLAVMERDAMLAGAAAPAFIEVALPPTDDELFFTVQPGHLEGPLLPPAGTCNRFVMLWDDEIWSVDPQPTDAYQVWQLCPDFAAPGNSTLSGPVRVDAGIDFDMELCQFANCIRQPGTNQRLDALSQFTMYRAALRASPTAAPDTLRLVVSGSVDVGNNQAGLHWAELDLTSTPVVINQGTFAPGGDSRWLPSIAMDVEGNLGIGYSRGGSQKAPSIYVTGRELGDPPNTLQDERACFDGAGVQTGTGRWVDYSSISVDPVDGCTFWYTTQYMPVTSPRNWGTRICAFQFPSCGNPRAVVQITSGNHRQDACAGSPLTPLSLDVLLSTGAGGSVTLGVAEVPPGFGVAYTANPVTAPGESTANISIGAVAAGSYRFFLTGDSAGLDQGRAAVDAQVFAAPPSAAAPIEPAFQLDLGTVLTFRWTAVADALRYRVEVDDDAGFGSPLHAVETQDTQISLGGMAAGAAYFWRVVAINPCGEVPSDTAFFTTADNFDHRVLLVDDDDNSPDVRDAFAAALTANALDFDVWDTGNTDDEPLADDLTGYRAVVWFTGDELDVPVGPSADSELVLSEFLDSGGCLLLSSQDYAFRAVGIDNPPNAFIRDYLGVASIDQDAGYDSVTGAGDYADIEEQVLDYPAAGISLNVSNYGDLFEPAPPAVTALVADTGAGSRTAAVEHDSGVFHTLYLGFPLPTVPEPPVRERLIEEFLVERCDALVGLSFGSMAGTVTSAGSGRPLPGARIRASRGGTTFTAVSDDAGGYRFPRLAPGYYELAVSLPHAPASEPLTNVRVLTDVETTQDFVLAGPELSYALSPLTATLGLDGFTSRELVLSNPGTATVTFATQAGNYAFGLPDPEPPAPSAQSILVRSSTGLAAALEAPRPQTSAPMPRLPGDVLYTGTYPAEGSPLGITMAPDGTVWVADLYSGVTQRYDQDLQPTGTVNDPIGPRDLVNATSGIAYDTVNDTLWWLDTAVPQLVEGDRSGVATGRTIAIEVGIGGFPAGVEYDIERDAFVYLDIVTDDIWAVNRQGVPLAGYPVPQTGFDTGARVFGNGLDVVDGWLDVLVGTDAEHAVTRAVVTDLFGNNSALVTDLTGVGDTFINDLVRSRIDPNAIAYVVGNATRTIYAIEPGHLLLANRWAGVTPAGGTIPAGGETTLQLTWNAERLTFGEYQATLAVAANAINRPPPLPLGLTVVGAPAMAVSLTGYVGADGGDRCLTDGGSEQLAAAAGSPLVLCIILINDGNTALADIDIQLPELGLSGADLLLRRGGDPLPAGQSMVLAHALTQPATPTTVTVNVTATAADAAGQAIPGPDPAAATDQLILADLLFASGFEQHAVD